VPASYNVRGWSEKLIEKGLDEEEMVYLSFGSVDDAEVEEL
jgi:hypothetical protein